MIESPKCPKCGSSRVSGLGHLFGEGWKCLDCGEKF